MSDVLNPIDLATRRRSAIPDEGAQDGNGGTALQWEYRTRVVKFNDDKGLDDQALKNASDTGYNEGNFEIIAVFPLDGDDKRYRLFMRREKPKR